MAEFEQSVANGNRLFILPIGNNCSSGITRHYGFVQSLQYGFIKNVLIPRGFYEAKKIKKENKDGRRKNNRSSKG